MEGGRNGLTVVSNGKLLY